MFGQWGQGGNHYTKKCSKCKDPYAPDELKNLK